ncbi:DUF982 domain-containing protein [Rhizobium sp. 57MFTsu3.2]|uniref:DUF982 domain-containing protein n=1 Tax=Rhizobium sp. 57MFTsu3.2 TaxID=1048681 RepID=UPI001469AEB8|nr:DUF982 domain-containing protein [Rhizobium sp. 57MFTsu3.2]NMN74206.1 uncharacterized protein DUF982 [Rhizobium sp. 57MFTsu3.2]
MGGSANHGLEAMEGLRDPEQARAAFVAAAIAAEMLMIKEEYIQQGPERRSAKNKRGSGPEIL